MCDAPTVAFLVPLYHGDRLSLLDPALNSVLAQDYPREKVRIYLVVDGPLPVTHAAWLARRQADLFKVIRLQENRGLANALNVLLDGLGDEKYLFRMDGDDLCAPDRVTRQVEFMEHHPDIDLVGANAIDIDEAGRDLGPRCYPEKHTQIIKLLPRLNTVLHPTYCIRAATLRRTGLRYPDAYLTEDLAFMFAAAAAGWRFHNLQETLLFWRQSADFLRRRFNPRRGWVELRIAIPGTWRLFGLSPELVWPVVRFGLRLLPPMLLVTLYRSPIRAWFSKSQP